MSISKLVLPREQAATLAEEAIGMFLEFRDKHDHDEAQARACAVAEFADGMSTDVDAELAATAESDHQLAAEIRRLPSLPSAPECDCRAVERGARFHATNCAISIWSRDERGVDVL